jgi:hypothetical protein
MRFYYRLRLISVEFYSLPFSRNIANPNHLVQELRVTGYQDGIKSLTHNTANRHHVVVVLKHNNAVCEERGANALMDVASNIDEVNGAFDLGCLAGLFIGLIFSWRPDHAALARLIEILRCKAAAAQNPGHMRADHIVAGAAVAGL